MQEGCCYSDAVQFQVSTDARGTQRVGNKILPTFTEATLVAAMGITIGARYQVPVEIGIVGLYCLKELLEITVCGVEIGLSLSDLFRYFKHPS